MLAASLSAFDPKLPFGFAYVTTVNLTPFLARRSQNSG
jgi:hypothetical protein